MADFGELLIFTDQMTLIPALSWYEGRHVVSWATLLAYCRTGDMSQLEFFQGVGVSIVRGTGRQTLGAVIIFVSFYCFALPVGIPLMFATKLELAGKFLTFFLSPPCRPIIANYMNV